MFPEVRGECEELNNSPQIEAAADGRPLTRYAAKSRSNGAARRVWRFGWRTREFGDLVGERESWETKDGDRESLETMYGERERLETKHGERERMETSRARQECGSGAAHRRATSITGIRGMAAVGGASIGSGT